MALTIHSFGDDRRNGYDPEFVKKACAKLHSSSDLFGANFFYDSNSGRILLDGTLASKEETYNILAELVMDMPLEDMPRCVASDISLVRTLARKRLERGS